MFNKKSKNEDKVKEFEKYVKANPVTQIINDVLYDTSKATIIFKTMLYSYEISDSIIRRVPDMDISPVLVFKGQTKYFIIYSYRILSIVSEDWVKDIISEKDLDTYIKLFGEPELA